MSAINESVSDERIANLIEVLSFYSPEDNRLANNESELASALRELQQYRATAEPVVSDSMALAFHAAITDSAAGADDIEEIKTGLRAAVANYAAPQVTSVPDIEELRAAFETVERESRDNFNLSEMLTGNYEDEYTQQRWEAWLDCRAFITAPAVQAGQLFGNTEQVEPVSQPYTLPDGCCIMPMKLTADNGAKGALSGEFSETKFINCPECLGDDGCETCDGSGRIEITVPVSWTTIKEIWAKGVEHFAAAPKQEAREVKK